MFSFFGKDIWTCMLNFLSSRSVVFYGLYHIDKLIGFQVDYIGKLLFLDLLQTLEFLFVLISYWFV